MRERGHLLWMGKWREGREVADGSSQWPWQLVTTAGWEAAPLQCDRKCPPLHTACPTAAFPVGLLVNSKCSQETGSAGWFVSSPVSAILSLYQVFPRSGTLGPRRPEGKTPSFLLLFQMSLGQQQSARGVPCLRCKGTCSGFEPHPWR